MFNILSGLQEGSRSVMLSHRTSASVLAKGTVVIGSAANTVVAADGADAAFNARAISWIFEDTKNQSSGKNTIARGIMECETDQFTDAATAGGTGTGGTIAALDYLMPGTGAYVGKLCKADSANIAKAVARCVDRYAIPSTVSGTSVTVIKIETLA